MDDRRGVSFPANTSLFNLIESPTSSQARGLRTMKICLVTTFPPSRGGLSEYGFHVASELQRNSFLSLTVLADTLDGKGPDPDGFAVDRCWSFNDPNSSTRLLRAIHGHKPDVVWFN